MSYQINDIFRNSRIARTGLKAGRTWMDAVSNNIANINTVDTGVKTKEGNFVPYGRQVPVFAKVLSEKFSEDRINNDVKDGVKIEEMLSLEDDIRKVYDPSHPAARKPGTKDAGYVYYPNVSLAQEMADMRMASAFYEANVTVVAISQRMNDDALSILRRA